MKTKATGQCFYNSFQTMMDMGKDAILVQGIVWHEKTGWHVHGWVELNDFCFDTLPNGKLVIVPKEKYYSLGKIKTGPGEIFKYTREEAMKKSLKAGNYYFSKLPCKN